MIIRNVSTGEIVNIPNIASIQKLNNRYVISIRPINNMIIKYGVSLTPQHTNSNYTNLAYTISTIELYTLFQHVFGNESASHISSIRLNILIEGPISNFAVDNYGDSGWAINPNTTFQLTANDFFIDPLDMEEELPNTTYPPVGTTITPHDIASALDDIAFSSQPTIVNGGSANTNGEPTYWIYKSFYDKSLTKADKKPSKADLELDKIANDLLVDFKGNLRKVSNIPVIKNNAGTKYIEKYESVIGYAWDINNSGSNSNWVYDVLLKNALVFYKTSKSNEDVYRLPVTSSRQGIEYSANNLTASEKLDAITMSCKAYIKDTKSSIELFGFKNIKNELFNSKLNTITKGFKIKKIMPRFKSKKTGKIHSTIILNNGDKNLMFLLSDIQILLPNFKSYSPKKDRTFKVGSTAKIKNNKGLGLQLNAKCHIKEFLSTNISRSRNKESIVRIELENSKSNAYVKLKHLKLI